MLGELPLNKIRLVEDGSSNDLRRSEDGAGYRIGEDVAGDGAHVAHLAADQRLGLLLVVGRRLGELDVDQVLDLEDFARHGTVDGRVGLGEQRRLGRRRHGRHPKGRQFLGLVARHIGQTVLAGRRLRRRRRRHHG